MCGIAGFVDFKFNSNLDTLTAMADSLGHRGPDDQGKEWLTVNKAQIGLGHRRLSIIDLSQYGHQPMNFGDWTIVFNGEIYNYREIAQSLEKEGYHSNLNSDTSVILQSFNKWGIRAVDKFIGMFAFAILNKKEEKIYFFRDRVGVKPLYYYWKDGLFLFSSELKAFHHHKDFRKEINNEALALFFRYGYIPAPYAIFADTYKINPGHYLEIDLNGGQLLEHKYWDVNDYYNKPKLQIPEEDALGQVESLLTSACNYRMVSDVPVGVFLSGGYDSVTVTTLLQKDRTEKIKTFTIGFEDAQYNEAPYAKEIADFLGTDHNEYYCTEKECKEIIPELSYFYDEPFGDSSAIPTILVSRMARKKVTVALSADGGDEIFGGYTKYESALKNLRRFSRIPNWSRHLLGSILQEINPSVLPLVKNKYRHQYIYEGFVSLLKSEKITAPGILNLSSQKVLSKGILKLFNKVPIHLSTFFDRESELNQFNDSLDTIMAIDYKTYLPDDILTKVDRATMSVSLEGREPLLDHRIIEYIATLPSGYKINGKVQKYLLKQIVHKYIPRGLVDRPKKGFGIPVKDWLRADLKFLLSEYLSKEKLALHGLFKEDFVHAIVRDYLAGKDDDFELIWLILQFQMWYGRWYNGY